MLGKLSKLSHTLYLVTLTLRLGMPRVNFDINEKYDMFCLYVKFNKSATRAAEHYGTLYPERRQPDIRMFKRLDENLKQYGSFVKLKRDIPVNEQKEEREDMIATSVTENPEISTREIEDLLTIPKTTVSKILRKNKYYPYKRRVAHGLRATDYPRREAFCRWYLEKCEADVNFSKKVLWTDESYFGSNGWFNRNNCHYWAQENPQNIVPRNNQGRFGCNVWCGIIGNRLLGPIFLEGNLNADSYSVFLTEQLENLLDDLPLVIHRDIWYQHDGAPAHNARRVRDYLRRRFNNKIITTHSDTPWPPRSPDITPLDFFLWGFVKDRVYRNRDQYNNRNELQQGILATFNINRHTLERATRGVARRCQICLENNGRNFEHLL